MTTITKYLNPRNDIAFKKIFGTEKNKDILKHFLNDVIVTEGKKPIREVTLLDPMQQPEIIHKKQSVLALAFILLGLSAFAQTDKEISDRSSFMDRVYVGGNVGFQFGNI